MKTKIYLDIQHEHCCYLLSHQIHPGKTVSDDVLDHPRLCSVLIWFNYPSCSEDGESIHETTVFGPIRFPDLDAWSNPYQKVGHPTNRNSVFRLLMLVFVG